MTLPARLQGAARLAALVAVGAALSGTSVAHGPGEARTFEAATSCGPQGEVTFTTDGFAEGPGCGSVGDETVDVAGGGAVGLPDVGALTPEAEDDPAAGESESRDLATGRFVLSGAVSLTGASPPILVDRFCRLAEQSPGVLAITCEGDAPEAACSGTLTLREASPEAP
jgi:hypothetical protein